MYKLFVLACIFAFGGIVHAQAQEPISVHKRLHKFRKIEQVKLGFAKGDLVVFKYKEIDGKSLKHIQVHTGDSLKVLYVSADKPMQGVFQYEMPDDDVLVFYLQTPDLLGRDLNVEILRTPASQETVNFSTDVVEKSVTDKVEVTYEKRNQIRIEEKSIPTKIEVFDKYVLEEVPMFSTSGQLLSAIMGDKSQFKVSPTLPPAPTPDAKLKYVSYYMNSDIGGGKHWAIAKQALPLAASFAGSVLLTPAGGAALGAGTNMMLDAMGPNENGEPTLVLLGAAKDMNTLNQAVKDGADSKKAMKVINETSGNSFYSMMTSLYIAQNYDTGGETFYLANADIMKAKNYRVDLKALYYAPVYVPVTVKEKVFTPIFETKNVTETFKISRTKLAPVGRTASATGEKYVLVEYPDTIWSVASQMSGGGEIVSIVPRIRRIKSQVTTKSEVVYSQSFAAMAEAPTASKIRLPDPQNDYYQTVEYKKIRYTLTVSNATYNALKNHVSTVIEAGAEYLVSVGTDKLTKMPGKKKIQGDESMTIVQKIVDAKGKYNDAKEVIETTKTIHDIQKNGVKAEEDEQIEGYLMTNGKKTNVALKKVGVNADVTEYIPSTMLNLRIPSISELSDKAAGVVTPKIKDNVRFKITPADNPAVILTQKETGFLVDSIELKDKQYNFNMYIENPRSTYDIKNFLSLYIFGSLMVEVEFEQTNYKDLIFFEEMRTPISGKPHPAQTYTVVTRTKYIPKSELKPYHKIKN